MLLPAVVTAKKKPPHFMSLHDAIMLALRFNPKIANAELDRITQKYALREAEHQFEWQPGLTGTAGYSRSQSATGTQTDETYNITPSASKASSFGTNLTVTMPNEFEGNQYNPEITVEVKQPLLKGFGSRVNLAPLKDAYDNELTNKLTLKDTIIRQVINVIRDYRNLITVNNNLATAKQSLKSAIKREKDTRIQIRAGRLPRTEIVEQQAQVQTLRLADTRGQNAQSQARHKLLEVIGLDPDHPISVPHGVSLNKTRVPNLHQTIDYALKHNLPYVKSLIGFRKVKRDLYIAKDNMRWQLDLDAQASTGGGLGSRTTLVSLLDAKANAESVGVTLTIPLDTVQLKSQLASASVSFQQTRINLTQKQRILRTSIRDEVTNIASLSQQVDISEKQVKLTRRSYELEVKKQQVGKASSLDVSVAQDKWIQSKRSLITAKISYLDAETSLNASLAKTLDIWGIKIRY